MLNQYLAIVFGVNKNGFSQNIIWLKNLQLAECRKIPVILAHPNVTAL
jgi:hypothetical protein